MHTQRRFSKIYAHTDTDTEPGIEAEADTETAADTDIDTATEVLTETYIQIKTDIDIKTELGPISIFILKLSLLKLTLTLKLRVISTEAETKANFTLFHFGGIWQMNLLWSSSHRRIKQGWRQRLFAMSLQNETA